MHFSEVIIRAFRIFRVHIEDNLTESRSGVSDTGFPLGILGGPPESNGHPSSERLKLSLEETLPEGSQGDTRRAH